jgi:hypothetical protein
MIEYREFTAIQTNTCFGSIRFLSITRKSAYAKYPGDSSLKIVSTEEMQERVGHKLPLVTVSLVVLRRSSGSMGYCLNLPLRHRKLRLGRMRELIFEVTQVDYGRLDEAESIAPNRT